MESFAFLQVLSPDVQSTPTFNQPEDSPIHEAWLHDVEPAFIQENMTQATITTENITASSWADVNADDLPQPRFWMMP